MQPTAEDKTQNNISLISDDEFVLLMEAEYNSSESTTDKEKQQKVWDKLYSLIRKNKLTRLKVIIPITAAALVLLAVSPLLVVNLDNNVERNKGIGTSLHVNLSSYVIDQDGGIHEVPGTIKSGNTIIFKVDMTQQAVIALSLSKNSGSPNVRFISSITQPGIHRNLQNNGKAYGYMLEPTDSLLRFCAIIAKDKLSLEKQIEFLTQIWQTLPENSCQTILVSNESN